MTVHVAAQLNPDRFVVTGGRAFAASVESLEASATSFDAVSAALGRVRQALYVARLRVEGAACTRSSVAPRISEESARIEAAVRRCVDEAAREASAVRRAAANYLEEEAKRRSALDGLQNLVVDSDVMAGLLSVFVPRGLFADRSDPASAPGRWAAAFMRFLNRAKIGGAPEDAIDVTRKEVVGGREEGGSFAYAVHALGQAQGHEPLEDGTIVPPSSILVERFPQADGSVAVMVTVPGTETWDLDSADGNVFDSESILDGMERRDSHVRTLIKEALNDQGLGPGDRVVFNSYSQGSIHVLGLLEEREFADRYHVAAVTSVGGPVSAFAVPDGVPVLSLSNADDVVPAASGRASPPSGSVVEVRTPSRIGPAATLIPKEAVASAHSLENYAGDASALDRSTAPGVKEFAAAVGAALGSSAAASGPGAGTPEGPVAGPVASGPGAGSPADASPGTVAAPAAPGQSGAARERFIYTGTDSRTKEGGGG
ncbi:hypothetical protein SPF06_13875 [Sinomonas sp. JGH33]|uniref:Uncharacterized protein n=1 Tax=Sinomonas terricola TaxID=3110330 RepID=A0ABU5T8H3_9MICC|nr:hypothetical protein [Sinomonas sp. JGH33]MEA5455819.1 hypothetical protein [Sinomonas sp. JGH33]